jgi:DNA-binding transcriptional regulator YiaG
MPRRIDVKAMRDEMGLSRSEMAEKLGVHERTVKRWEEADHDPSPLANERLRTIHREHTGKKPTNDPADHLPEPLRGLLPSMR